jgi:hypothetical protein
MFQVSSTQISHCGLRHKPVCVEILNGLPGWFGAFGSCIQRFGSEVAFQKEANMLDF